MYNYRDSIAEYVGNTSCDIVTYLYQTGCAVTTHSIQYVFFKKHLGIVSELKKVVKESKKYLVRTQIYRLVLHPRHHIEIHGLYRKQEGKG